MTMPRENGAPHFKEGGLTMKDYSKLNKQLVLVDMYEDREDCDVIAGVAIPAESMDDFAAAVQKLAVEEFGGATFSELLDYDENDESMDAAVKQNFNEQVGRVIAAAERIMGNGR